MQRDRMDAIFELVRRLVQVYACYMAYCHVFFKFSVILFKFIASLTVRHLHGCLISLLHLHSLHL